MATLCKVIPTVSNTEYRYTWATQYQCHICCASYYLCSICDSAKSGKTMFLKSRLKRHNTLHLELEKMCCTTNNLKRKYDNVTNRGDLLPENMSEKSFDRKETYNYYTFNESKGDGAAFLVGNALC